MLASHVTFVLRTWDVVLWRVRNRLNTVDRNFAKGMYTTINAS
jgi:hypothetical protein